MIVGLCGVAGSGKDTVADFLVKNHGFVKVAFADPLKRICKNVFQFSDEQLWGPSHMRNAADPRYPRPENAGSVVAHQERCTKCGAEHVAPLDGSLVEKKGEPLHGQSCPEGGEHDVRQANLLGKLYLSPRYALQQLGSEWGRDCYQNVWVDYALRVAKMVLGHNGITECTYSARKGLYWRKEDGNESVLAPNGVVISDVRFRNEIDAIHAAGGKVIKIVRKSAGLKGAAAQHMSEVEQHSIPDDAFDHHLLNGGTSLDLLECAVDGLVATLGVV